MTAKAIGKNHNILIPDAELVVIDYTNWQGKRSVRVIWPLQLWYGGNKYHPGEQWLLGALDTEKAKLRVFAMAKIHSWEPVE